MAQLSSEPPRETAEQRAEHGDMGDDGATVIDVAEAPRVPAATPPPSPPPPHSGPSPPPEGVQPVPAQLRFLLKPAADATDATTSSSASPLSRWKQAGKAAQQEVLATNLTKRWHKDVDSFWKRLLLSCRAEHSLCAGICYRGVPGWTRAQSVMVLMNSIAFTFLWMLIFYEMPEPDEAQSFNPVGIAIGAIFGALVGTPAMMLFAWLFEPVRFVRLGSWLLRTLTCRHQCCLRRCAKQPVIADANVAETEGAPKARKAAKKVSFALAFASKAASNEQQEAPPAEEARALHAQQTANIVRNYSYESLDGLLLRSSLTESHKRRDWRSVCRILFGWTCNYAAFGAMLFVAVAYACELFESEPGADGNSALPDANATSVGVLIIFALGATQRFLLNEPMMLLANKGLPELLASAFCKNCLGEATIAVIERLLEAVAACLAAMLQP